MRCTKNRLTHNSIVRGWISVLACRWGRGVVTFTTLIGGTETVLTERLDKITLRGTLTAHSLK